MSNNFNRTSRRRRLGEPLFPVDDPEEALPDLDQTWQAPPAPRPGERFALRIPADIEATYQRSKQRTAMLAARSATASQRPAETRQVDPRPTSTRVEERDSTGRSAIPGTERTRSGIASRRLTADRPALPAVARNATLRGSIRPDQDQVDTLTVPRHSRLSVARAPLDELAEVVNAGVEPALELPPRYASAGMSIAAQLNQPFLHIIIGLFCAAIIATFFWSLGQQRTVLSFQSIASNNASAVVSPPQAAALPAPGDYQLRAAPSLSPAQIDQILRSYGSPAAGTGNIWYRLGQEYNIDPAFALAFFIHESGAGTNPNWAGRKPDGSTTHNVGNIICAGYPTCYGRFRDYPDWETGIADWYRLIDVEYLRGRGLQTVADVIPIYAPAVENDVQGYINVVHSLVDRWRQGQIP